MDMVDMVTKEADKVVEKVAKVGDLIILVSLDWWNLVLLEFTICTLQSFQSYLEKHTRSKTDEFSEKFQTPAVDCIPSLNNFQNTFNADALK